MIVRSGLRVSVGLLSLLLAALVLPALAQDAAGQETLREEHSGFYRAGAALDISDVLGLENLAGRKVLTVTIGYNMSRSELGIEWLCDNDVLGRAELDQGMRKEATFTFDRPLPSALQARFTGSGGQVQVRWVSAVTAPLPGAALIVEGVAQQQGKIIGIKPTGGQVAVVAEQEQHQVADDAGVTVVGLAPFVTKLEIAPLPLLPGRPSTATVTLSKPALSDGELRIECLDSEGERASRHLRESRFDVGVAEGAETISFELVPRDAIPDAEEIEVVVGYGPREVSEKVLVRYPPAVAGVEIHPQVIRPGTTAIGRVFLAEPALVGGAVLPLNVFGDKAAAVQVPDEVVVEAGEREVEFEISADPASEDEPLLGSSGVLLGISADDGVPGNTNYQANARILQPDIYRLRFEPREELRAGDTAHVTLTLDEPASPGGTVVWLRTEGPDHEVSQVPERLWIAEGETGGSFPIAVGATSSGFFEIEARTALTNHRARVDIRYGVPIADARLEAPLRPGTKVDLVVELAEPAMAGGATIALSSSGDNATLVDVASQIHIEEGDTTGTFEISVSPQEGGEEAAQRMADQTARLVLFEVSTPVITKGQPIPSKRTAQGLITQAEVQDVRFAVTPIKAGQTTVATVTLREPASPGGTVVWLSVGGFAGEFATVPDEIRIAEGETSRDVQVPVDVAASERIAPGITVELEARTNDKAVSTAALVDYPTWIESVEIEPPVILIGESFTLTVTMKDPVPWDPFRFSVRAGEPSWNPNSSPGSPRFNCLQGGGSPAIPKGETTVTLEFNIASWCEHEGPVNFWVMTTRLNHLRVPAPAEVVLMPKIESLEVVGEPTVAPGSTVSFQLTFTKRVPAGGVRVKLVVVEPSIPATWPDEINLTQGDLARFDVVFPPTTTGRFTIRAEIFVGGLLWSDMMRTVVVQSP